MISRAPRLYLAAPAGIDAEALTAALSAGDVACLELPAAPDVAPVVSLAQAHGVAVLIADDAAAAATLGADGVAIDSVAGYRAARAAVGPQAIVGIRALASRHDAMLAGEAGADFVGLAGEADLVAWWAELMEPPAVAFAATSDPAALAALAQAGADFVCPDAGLWDDTGAVGRRVAALQQAIETAALKQG